MKIPRRRKLLILKKQQKLRFSMTIRCRIVSASDSDQSPDANYGI